MPAATLWTCRWESVEVLTALPDGVADACIVTRPWWAGLATLVRVPGGLLSLLGGRVALRRHWRLATLRRRGGVSMHNGDRRAPERATFLRRKEIPMSRLSLISLLLLILSVTAHFYLAWSLYTTQHAQQVQLSVVTQVLDTMLQREGRRLQGTALPSGMAPVPLPMGETLLRAVLLPHDTGQATPGGYVTSFDPRCLPGRDHPPGGQAEELTVSSTSPTLTEPSRLEAATDRLLWTVSPSRP